MKHLPFNTKKNEKHCDVSVASHISTCKHFSIPRGATNSEPNHTITGVVKKLGLVFMYILARQLPILQNSSYNLTQQCCCQTDRSAGMLRSSMGISNSLVLWWMWKEQIIIHIPQSLPLHTHRTSCYLDTIQYTLQSQPGCASS